MSGIWYSVRGNPGKLRIDPGIVIGRGSKGLGVW